MRPNENGPAHAPALRLGSALLLRLLLPLVLIMVATAALSTYTAHRLTARVFDHWLLDAANSVGALVHFDAGAHATIDLPDAARAVVLYDDVDRTWFGVMQGERALTGSADLPRGGAAEIRYAHGRAYDTVVEGHHVRVAAVTVGPPGQEATVYVAETLTKRRRSQKSLLLMLWPMAALILAAALAVVLAVRRTLRPLESIASRWRRHSHDTLEPILPDDVPHELVPFADALNDLLERIRAMIARERKFSTMVAHQLRTPLTSLQLGLARALEASDLPAAQRVMRELGGSAQRSARLVQQLLALGRLDPEVGSHPDFGLLDLRSLLEDVGAAHADQAFSRGVDLELRSPDHPVIARLQPDLFAEAAGNLIDNALRYTPRGGLVLVEVTDRPPRVRVSDSGPGIPPEDRERVFERFARGRAASGDGSGLGLAIVHDVAALHRARVHVADSPLGGASLVVTFPAPIAD